MFKLGTAASAAAGDSASKAAIQVKDPFDPARFTNPIDIERYLLKNEIIVYHTKVYRYSYFQPVKSQSYQRDHQMVSMKIRFGEIAIVRKANDYPYRFRFGLFDPTEPKWVCNEVIKDDLKLEHEPSTATIIWKSVTDKGTYYPLSMRLWDDSAAECFMKVFEGCQKLESIQMRKKGLVLKQRMDDVFDELFTEHEKQLRDSRKCAAKFFQDIEF